MWSSEQHHTCTCANCRARFVSCSCDHCDRCWFDTHPAVQECVYGGPFMMSSEFVHETVDPLNHPLYDAQIVRERS